MAQVHHGRGVKRIREILQIKQEVLADTLGISQQSVSLLETKETIDAEMLQSIAQALGVPPEAIKHFDENAAISIVANSFSDFKEHAIASAMNYQCSFNPIDKVVELLERSLKEKDAEIERLREELAKLRKK
ncbi:helix-turn-helix domain-containing protein [Chitinophaga defluvii]|uniref:Helix-turn-helix transcriptional regulator n=1 Tax=Chitinophaga defluvii TaxID=3163343 RepID=A0ABV2T1F0_9BACT